MSESIGKKVSYAILIILILALICWYATSLILDWLILSNKYEATNPKLYNASKWTIRVTGWLSMIISIFNGIVAIIPMIELVTL